MSDDIEQDIESEETETAEVIPSNMAIYDRLFERMTSEQRR